MSLVLYNTLTGRKEPFVPVVEGQARIYVCGPTVYDHSHIGHARAVVVFDVLYRHLVYLGYEVTYVRNFTDVDDKIIARAQEEGIDFKALADRHIQSFHEDMDSLGALRPTYEPRATDYIDGMIADVAALIERGYAYQVDGDVYYDIAKFADYGRLSKRNTDDMQAGARVDVDERKKSPLDFALWKKSKPGEPYWESPWGLGRPGWHIECSAMSDQLLGAEFDIHGGGHDLVFPHHENEIAQAAGLGRSFAKYWMHNGFVRVDNQKMSKSLKNFFTIKEVLARFHPEIVRLFLLSKHYRSPVDFSDEALAETGRSLDRAYRALAEAENAAPEPGEGGQVAETESMKADFTESLNDDLNTARALGSLFEGIRELNRLLDEKGKKRKPESIRAWARAIQDLGRVLGLLELDPQGYFDDRKAQVLAEIGLTDRQVEEMIEARTRARAEKNWAEADRVRDELKAKGILLEDVKGETRWRIE